MDKMKDIKLEKFDLAIKNGDFVIAPSTRQHQEHLLLAHPGEFRHAPFMGVGLTNYLLDDENSESLKVEIQEQFTADGMEIREINILDTGHIQIEAEYV